MNDNSNIDDRIVTIQRTFSAPIALVWSAWTEAEHISKWWGPEGMEVKVIKHDFRVGGEWQYIMKMPNGQDFITDGVYTEVVELEKIFSSANFKPMTEGVEIQALFEENGDKTNFTFNVVHPTVAYRIQQENMGILNGWGSVFNRLESFVSADEEV